MSATPIIYDIEDSFENNYNIEDILGKIIYKMSFEYAITNNYISNYELYLPVYDEDNYNQLLEQIKINNYDNLLIKKVLYYFESIKILGKLKTIIYFNSHEHIDIFMKCFNDVDNYYNYKYNIDSILCSVGILDECIDIPSCDSVYITYNCVSRIRIIQRISRALRKHNNKIAKILIWIENINNINPVINAIKEIDNDIITKIKYIEYNNKILSLDEQVNIQKYNSNTYNKDIDNIDTNIDIKNNIYINDNILEYNNNKIIYIIDINNIIWFKFLSICKILNYKSSKCAL